MAAAFVAAIMPHASDSGKPMGALHLLFEHDRFGKPVPTHRS